MEKFQRGCEERSNAKAKSLARQRLDSDDEVELTSVVQQDRALNPNVVDGKQKFGFEIGEQGSNIRAVEGRLQASQGLAVKVGTLAVLTQVDSAVLENDATIRGKY